MKKSIYIIFLSIFFAFAQVVNAQSTESQPVEGLKYSLEVKGNNVIVDWNTLNHEAIESIGIERSADGNNFIQIYQTYSIAKQSSYSDAIFGQYTSLYYRLTISYADGTSTKSEIKSIDLSDGNHLKPIIYSNSSTITVEFFSKRKESTVLYIFNTTSRMVDEQSIVAEKGENRLNFNSLNLKQGLYFLQISQGGETTTTKFFVQ